MSEKQFVKYAGPGFWAYDVAVGVLLKRLLASNRAHGAVDQNNSRAMKRAAKQEKFQPLEECFFLTSPFTDAGSNGRMRHHLI